MTVKKNGLNDFDKIFVTAALWISAVTVFVTALTLPMLPDMVRIFYSPAEGVEPDSYSKYNNLFLIFASIIPASIILIAALLKKHNRLNNNFLSMVLFSIALSVCISSIVIFGINQQFDASFSVKDAEVNCMVCLFSAFALSMASALLPLILRDKTVGCDMGRRSARLAYTLVEFWNVGAYGYLLVGIACTFTPSPYCYIPLAIGIVAHVVFSIVNSRLHKPKSAV